MDHFGRPEMMATSGAAGKLQKSRVRRDWLELVQ